MARIAIFIDSDIIIRHFLLNKALADLEKNNDVLYVFPENHRRVQFDISKLSLPRVATVGVSNDRTYLYRRLHHASVLKRLRRTPDGKMAMQFWRDQLGRKPFWESWLFSWPFTYPFYRRRMISKIGDNPSVTSLLEKEKPDIILHPSVLEGLFVSDLVKWGKENNVPTVFLMNSWDNPATKAMMAGYPDWLVVWGEPSKGHAVEYMGMNPERVLCLGGAQFDHYRRAPLQSAEEYKRQIGVPAGKKILVYAGSSKGLNETRHLEMLENAIQQGIIKNTVVLYRPHPWRAFPENEKDFFDMHFQHVIMDPNMVDCYKNYRGSNRLFIELADYEHTHTLLNAVDAVISPLSTILLEATMHGKPTAAYLPDEDMKQNKWLFTFSNMVHFREFFQHVDCLKCEDASRLVSDCKTLLDRAAQPGIAEKLKEQSKPFIYMSRESYGERVNQLVSDILAKRQVVGASKL